LASPYQYPWVEFFQTPTPNIDSTPTIICGAQAASIVDSIRICNMTQKDIFVDIKCLAERNLVSITTYWFNKILVPKNGTIQLLLGDCETLENGDLLYASSDFSGNKFDCTVSGRKLLETA
jgi:hypothetical protein